MDIVSRKISEFIEENENRVVAEMDPNEPGMVLVTYNEAAIPDMLTVHIGRIVGCLKSALDNVAVEAALEVNPEANTSRIVFPFSGNKERDGCDKWFAGKVGPMKDAHRRIIVEARPYIGGNHALLALKELRDADEHLSIQLAIARRQSCVSLPSMTLEYSAPKPDGSIEVTSTYSGDQPEFETTMHVGFSEPLSQGKEVVAWLRDMIAATRDIICKFDQN